MTWKEKITDIFDPGGGQFPVQYMGEYQGNEYYVRYRNGLLNLEENDEIVLEREIGDEYDGIWTDKKTSVYLSILSQAIIANDFANLHIPKPTNCKEHPHYAYGPYPFKPVGLRCMRKADPIPVGLTHQSRHNRKRIKALGLHIHETSCIIGVRADEYDSWKRANPDSHRLFQAEHPTMHKWAASLR